MTTVLLGLAALVPVLVIGSVLIELLLRAAPRRRSLPSQQGPGRAPGPRRRRNAAAANETATPWWVDHQGVEEKRRLR